MEALGEDKVASECSSAAMYSLEVASAAGPEALRYSEAIAAGVSPLGDVGDSSGGAELVGAMRLSVSVPGAGERGATVLGPPEAGTAVFYCSATD